jgi:NhaA family Na+:H+ antiporter
LFAGKPLGILTFSYLSVKMKLTMLPSEITFKQLTGAGFLGGIGFTMAIFITLLAFQENEIIEQFKIAVMISSLLAGLVGFAVLKSAGNRRTI